MNVIAIINQKGGVAKTTTAEALGEGLAAFKRKVLLIDLDPQGNLSFSLNARNTGQDAFTVLQNPDTIRDAVQMSRLSLVASTPQLAGADNVFTFTGKEYRLKEALCAVAGDYEYCVIDTPPALGILTVNALTAADEIIIPVQTDVYSMQGIEQLNNTIEAVQRYTNPKLTISGALLTRYNGRGRLSRDIAEIMEETARALHTAVYKAKIRECVALREAAYMQQSIYEYAPNSNAAKDYTEFVKEFIEHEKGL